MIDSILSAIAANADPAALLDATVKATVLLLLGLGLARMRRLSPAIRSWVLSMAQLSLPLIVGLSFFGPIRRLSISWPKSVSPVVAPVSPAVPMPVDIEVTRDPASPPPIGKLAEETVDWPMTALAFWVGGMAVLGAWRLAGNVWRRRRRARLSDWKDPPFLAELEGIARSAGLRRTPRLVVAERWAMPSTWGCRRPAIVLPREAENWPLTRTRHVLWHEVAHIVRRDALADAITAVTTLALWFHPLVWLTRRVAGRLREAACDDLVLTHGRASAAEYSADLLAIVRRHFSPSAVAGLAMAQSSAVGSRVRRLLAVDVPRGNLSRRGFTLTTGLWLGLCAAVAFSASCRSPRTAASTASAERTTSIRGKIRAGAKPIRFAIVEITVPDDRPSPFHQWLPDREGRSALAFESLAWLSQQKGVDLIAAPEVREGQTAAFSQGALSAEFSGEVIEEGRTIETTTSIWHRAVGPSGAGSVWDFPNITVRVPNGGFVIFTQTHRVPSRPLQPSLLRLIGEKKIDRYFAISASSNPLPPAAQSALTNGPKPGDASFARAQKLAALELKFFSKPHTARWPVSIPPADNPTVSGDFISGMLASPDITSLSYPRVVSRLDRNVLIRNTVLKPIRVRPKAGAPTLDANGKPIVAVDLATVGTSAELLPSLDRNGRLVLQSHIVISNIVGDEIDQKDGTRYPIVSSQRLDSEIAFPSGRNTVILGQFTGSGKGADDTVIAVSAKTFTNP